MEVFERLFITQYVLVGPTEEMLLVDDPHEATCFLLDHLIEVVDEVSLIDLLVSDFLLQVVEQRDVADHVVEESDSRFIVQSLEVSPIRCEWQCANQLV